MGSAVGVIEMNNEIIRPIRAILVHKVGVLFLVVISLNWHSIFNTTAFHTVARCWPVNGEPNWTSRLATWDGAHYLYLADVYLADAGYRAGDMSCAFYPLWPGLIHLTKPLFGGNPLAAGLALANGLSLVGLLLFYRLVAERHGQTIADASVLLLLACPGALFFCFPYSEALFFVLVMVLFQGLLTRRLPLVCLAGYFLPLTRAVGVFAVLPLGWQLLNNGYERWDQHRSKARRSLRFTGPNSGVSCSVEAGEQGNTWRRAITHLKPLCGLLTSIAVRRLWLGVLAILAGYATYFALMYATTGNPTEGFAAQRLYPNSPSIRNILNVQRLVASLFEATGLYSMTGSVIDRSFFIIFLVTLPAIWRLERCFFWYALGTGLVPAMSSWFISYNRYIEMCFPIFIVIGAWLVDPAKQWLFRYYFVLATGLQTVSVIRHINFYWAG